MENYTFTTPVHAILCFLTQLSGNNWNGGETVNTKTCICGLKIKQKLYSEAKRELKTQIK